MYYGTCNTYFNVNEIVHLSFFMKSLDVTEFYKEFNHPKLEKYDHKSNVTQG